MPFDTPPFRIDDDDLLMTDDYVYLYQKQAFTGISNKTIYGRKVSETTYREGIPYGRRKIWDYEEGYLKSESWMHGSAYHGMVQEWYENGQRKSLEYYEHGICCKGITWNQFAEIVDICILNETDSNFEILKYSRQLYPDKLDLPNADQELQKELHQELDKIIEENE